MLNKEEIMIQLEENQAYLPIGFEDETGLHRIVTLRVMDGEGEENVTDSKVSKNGGKIITEFLYNVVESIDGIKKVTKEHIRKMFTADRDYLMLASYGVSFGDEIKFTVKCPTQNCGAENELRINVSNIESTWNADTDPRTFTFTLPNGVKDGLGNLYNVVVVGYPTGEDLEAISPIVKQSPGKANTMLLHRITKSISGEKGELHPLNPDTFRKLSRKDRMYINDELKKITPGADYSVIYRCSSCGEEHKTSIPTNAFLGM